MSSGRAARNSADIVGWFSGSGEAVLLAGVWGLGKTNLDWVRPEEAGGLRGGRPRRFLGGDVGLRTLRVRVDEEGLDGGCGCAAGADWVLLANG